MSTCIESVLQAGERSLTSWRYTFDNVFQWPTQGRGTWSVQFDIPVSAGASSTTWITQWYSLKCP
jgi:hypothetical protein